MPRDIVSTFSGLRPEVSALALGAWAAAVSAYDLTSTQRDRIKSAYGSLGEFFRSDARFEHLAIEVHPQGSVAIGTTVRPTSSAEFDVDLVVALHRIARHVHVAPASLLRDLWATAADYARAHGLTLERKRRCAQLRYADDMHADVTAVIQSPQGQTPPLDSAGVVPDREAMRYYDTNPKGYAWCFNRGDERK
jgi:hypothetical protein